MKKLRTKQDLEDVANAIEQDLKLVIGQFCTLQTTFKPKEWEFKKDYFDRDTTLRLRVYRFGEDGYLPAYILSEFIKVLTPYTNKYDMVFFTVDALFLEIEKYGIRKWGSIAPCFEIHICNIYK